MRWARRRQEYPAFSLAYLNRLASEAALNDEGMRHVDIHRAAREACEALTAYAAAVARGQRDQELDEVRGALTRSLRDYGAAAFNAGVAAAEDLDELVEDLETDWDDVEDISEEFPAGSRIAIFQRTDFVVEDAAAVISAGRKAYGELFPDDRPEEVDAYVHDVPSAVGELLHRQGEVVVDYLSRYGLLPAGSATEIAAVERALQEEDIGLGEWSARQPDDG